MMAPSHALEAGGSAGLWMRSRSATTSTAAGHKLAELPQVQLCRLALTRYLYLPQYTTDFWHRKRPWHVPETHMRSPPSKQPNVSPSTHASWGTRHATRRSCTLHVVGVHDRSSIVAAISADATAELEMDNRSLFISFARSAHPAQSLASNASCMSFVVDIEVAPEWPTVANQWFRSSVNRGSAFAQRPSHRLQ